MKKHLRTLSVVLVVLVLASVLGSWVFAQGSDSQPESTQGVASLAGSDSQPVGPPEVVIPAMYQPSAEVLAAPPPVPTTPVYFTPQDENSSATVIFLYNTSGTARIVRIQTWQLNGNAYVDEEISVPAHGMVRICTDPINSTSLGWQDVVLVNFRTLSAYARMLLPEGVKADAYVVWNGASDYDPDDAVPTLNIRFSTDPESVYLPAVHSD